MHKSVYNKASRHVSREINLLHNASGIGIYSFQSALQK